MCLPLSSKKWSKLDFHQLTRKITQRLKTGYAKMLSYAGRLQIITAVLFSIHNFWGAVFILPQSVVKEVDRLCREYLWGNNQEKRKLSLVSWDKLCIPKKYGGLNIKGCRIWNIASVGKLLWQLSSKQDSRWIKWIHGLCMKSDINIWMHRPPNDCSWYWKKLDSLKNDMINWYTNGRYILTYSGFYSITSSYNTLIGAHIRCRIDDLVWTAVAQPKHRFVLWLAVQGRLLTKARLIYLNISIDSD